MIDAIAGDAVHILFNVPLERDDHVDAALDCARAIFRFAEEFRHMPEACAAGFGRTGSASKAAPRSWGRRGSRRLITTAHGDAINLTARLEAANKEFGSASAWGRAPPRPPPYNLRALGSLTCAGSMRPLRSTRWRTSAHRGQSSCNPRRSPHLGRRRRPARHHDIGPLAGTETHRTGPRPHVDAPLAHEDAKTRRCSDRRRNSCRGRRSAHRAMSRRDPAQRPADD